MKKSLCKQTGCNYLSSLNNKTGKSYYYCDSCRKREVVRKKERYGRSKNTYIQYGKDAWKRHKKKFLDVYGRKCGFCDESSSVFLQFDHINGGGAKHRNEVGNWSIYKDATSLLQTDKYQVLCANCNCKKKIAF